MTGELIDLHVHLGGAVPAAVLWEILCDSGLYTEFKSFDALQHFLTVEYREIHNLDDFLHRYFHATELIQSSPRAAEEAIYQAVAKAYRRAKITGMEVRFNPLKRINDGWHQLDSLILASIQGLQRVSRDYRVKTGILFSLGKEISFEKNAEIVDAAIRFSSKGSLCDAYGVVGIDMAGPESLGKDRNRLWLMEMSQMFDRARDAGLGLTWHVGETPYSGPEGMEQVISIIRPNRIGHGIELRKTSGKMRDRLCGLLRDYRICLEICPTVNEITRSVESIDEIIDLIFILDKEKIDFCLNTDNPYLVKTNLHYEYERVCAALGAQKALISQSYAYAAENTFMKKRLKWKTG